MTGMEENFKEKLLRHAWPGNVRELRNVIERACILENTEKLTAGHLPFELRFADHTDQSLLKGNLALSEAEKKHIYKVLAFTEGNKTKAAELLGIGLTTLYTKLREYETPS